MASPICHAAATVAPTAAAPGAGAAAPGKTGTHRHWRHWSRRRHSAHTTGYGRGHSLRWRTVRDSSGHRHKQWYYADTGENASGPDDDDSPALRDLDEPISRREQEALHERRVKALAHLAEVEQRVENDRRQRELKAKTRFHRLQAESAAPRPVKK